MLGNSIAQTTMYSYPFESGDYTNQQCFTRWSTAGSSTYKATRNPYRVIDAVKDFGLKTDGSDCSFLIDSIKDIKKSHPNDLIVVYFPPGTYVFNNIEIKLAPFTKNGITYSMNNVILKGSNNFPGSALKFNHSTVGLYIKDCQQIGIEDLFLHRITNATSGSNIRFENSSDCWVSGVSSYEAYKFHIELLGAGSTATSGVHNITITGCLFYDALAHGGDGEGYGVQLDGAYNCLVDNCIFRKLRHSISFQQDPSFNVIAYNASYEPVWEETGLVKPPDLSFHGRFNTDPGPHHNLSEGNRVEQIKIDISHGSNGPHNTFLRTYSEKGLEISTTPFNKSHDYVFDIDDQHNQNIIGVHGVSDNQMESISGTKIYCDKLLVLNDAPTDMNANVTSYYTWNQKPEYLSVSSWPYVPNISHNDAENRSNSPYYELLTKYYCGNQIAQSLFIGNNQNVTSGTYKAFSTIISGSLKIKTGTSVEFKATESTTLVKDFEVEPGAEFIINAGNVACP